MNTTRRIQLNGHIYAVTWRQIPGTNQRKLVAAAGSIGPFNATGQRTWTIVPRTSSLWVDLENALPNVR
jgi:hypothetical protein